MEFRRFDSVLTEDLTLREQAELFASAAIVLSPHGAALTNRTEDAQAVQRLDRARRQKSTAYLVPRKPVSFECHGIHALLRELSDARRPGETSSDNHHIDALHFSATSTSR